MNTREDRENINRNEFEEWWKAVGYHAMPNEQEIPPKFFVFYKTAARMAWQERHCRCKIEVMKAKDNA